MLHSVLVPLNAFSLILTLFPLHNQGWKAGVEFAWYIICAIICKYLHKALALRSGGGQIQAEVFLAPDPTFSFQQTCFPPKQVMLHTPIAWDPFWDSPQTYGLKLGEY